MQPIHVGQEWSYHTRPDEVSSTLVVLRIDADSSLGTIVHIAVNRVRIRNPRAPGGYSTTLPHAPVSERALRASITGLVTESVPLPDFREGYDLWKRGKGGVWTLSMAEIVAAVEEALGRS